MINRQFFTSKFFVIALLIVLLIIFNLTRRPIESETSKEFQSVVANFERQSKAALKDGRQAPRVAISVKNITDPAKLNYSLNNDLKTDDPMMNETLTHLLDLLYEAGVVTMSGPQQGTFQVKIEINNQLFDGSFEQRDVSTKTSLATFLKLMQLHGRGESVARVLE